MKLTPRIKAFSAALLFGASAPLAKLLLAEMEPLQLAGILYLGSGTGVLLLRLFMPFTAGDQAKEAFPGKHDLAWLSCAILCGGIAAPLALMTGLARTPASTASLLLNFEAVSTGIIALVFFREYDNIRFYISLPFMITGAWLLYSEKHYHLHRHDGLVHEHRHTHDDMHHDHKHEPPVTGYHTHVHQHDGIEHTHEHYPDIHHRHVH